MINTEVALDIIKTVGTTDTIITHDVYSFTRDSNQFTSVNSITVSRYKPMDALFIFLPTVSSDTANSITLEIMDQNGAVLVIEDFFDDTKGFTRSGFISWNPQRDAIYNQTRTSNPFKIKLTFTNPVTAEVGGINLVFCDKQDILREFPDLDALMGISGGDDAYNTTLMRMLEASRDDIEKKIKDGSFRKQDRSYFFSPPKELDRWDLLRANEVRLASVYWTLAKIFFFLSDSPNDQYIQKFNYYISKAEGEFESASLSIDSNDDGSLDVLEGERTFGNVQITFEL